MTSAPLVLIDGMMGFRITSGMIVLNLTFTRSDFDGEKVVNFLQPTVDLAMPIPVLRLIMTTLEEELARAEVNANLTPHGSIQ